MIMLYYTSFVMHNFVSQRPLEVILLQRQKSLFSPFTGSVISPEQNQSKAVRVSIQLINKLFIYNIIYNIVLSLFAFCLVSLKNTDMACHFG